MSDGDGRERWDGIKVGSVDDIFRWLGRGRRGGGRGKEGFARDEFFSRPELTEIISLFRKRHGKYSAFGGKRQQVMAAYGYLFPFLAPGQTAIGFEFDVRDILGA